MAAVTLYDLLAHSKTRQREASFEYESERRDGAAHA
jgi:hypothetical protein